MRLPNPKIIRKFARRLHDRVCPGGLILMYHRIAETDCDPWGNCVSPSNFVEQLEVIKRLAQPTRLEEMTNFLAQGNTPRRLVTLTFDDGYADNCRVAQPLLESHDVPATFFLVSGRMGEHRSYWSDELASILLRSDKIPQSLELALGDSLHAFHFGAAADHRDEERWKDCRLRAWSAPPQSRLAGYNSVWKLLRLRGEPEQVAALDQLRQWAGLPPPSSTETVTITEAEAREIAAGGLIEIGSHSRSHPVLSGLPACRQKQEISESKSALEAVIGRPVGSFAYPYGEYARETPLLVKEAGYVRACTVVPRQVRAGEDPILLPRFPVLDWGGEEFARRLFGLLSW